MILWEKWSRELPAKRVADNTILQWPSLYGNLPSFVLNVINECKNYGSIINLQFVCSPFVIGRFVKRRPAEVRQATRV